jgi:protein arginine N-methyltransferase 1
MYCIADYGAMIADSVRTGAFLRSLRQVVTPRSVVVDIGTGTGIFAFIACRFGARRVYAIEPSDAIQVARDIAAANGLSDRIEFIQAMSTEIELPERADVIVSDIGGTLPWFQRHIPAIVDARERLLAPGGTLIPEEDTAWIAVVDVPDVYTRQTAPWKNNEFGLNMDAAHRIVVNTFTRGRVAPEQMLTAPHRWTTLDYRSVTDSNVTAKVCAPVTRRGTGHGLIAGFDRIVLNSERLSNAPDADPSIKPQNIYGTVFFPWPEPVTLEPGDLVRLELSARLIGNEYTWNWATSILDEDGAGGEPKANFSQSTFFGAPLSPARLQKRAARYIPVLGRKGQMTKLVLDSMARGCSLAEIAVRVSAEFSALFPHPHDALAFVADLSQEFG